MELYPTLLGFKPVVTESYQMSLTRNCFLPMVREIIIIKKIFFVNIKMNCIR